MSTKRYTDEQIAHALRAVQDGVTVREVCRKFGVTEQTVYRWKKKFGAMMPSEIKRLKQLEDENRRLKSIVADLTLDKQMLQEVLQEKSDAFASARRGQGASLHPWRERTTSSEGSGLATKHAPLRKPREGPDGAADEAPGSGSGSPPLWLSASDRTPATRRLDREPQARLPPLL